MAKNRYRKITSTTQAGKVSFFSTLFFQWMNILLKTGSERAIDENDLLPLEKENTSCFLAEELRAKWAEETTNSKKNDIKPKLWKSILKVLTARDIIILISAMSVWTLSYSPTTASWISCEIPDDSRATQYVSSLWQCYRTRDK